MARVIALVSEYRALRWRLRTWARRLRHDAQVGFVVRLACEYGMRQQPPSRLLLPMRDLACDTLVFVTSRRWWELAWWRLVGPLARVLVMLGAWDVEPGRVFTSGRFNWRIWRAGRPWGA